MNVTFQPIVINPEITCNSSNSTDTLVTEHSYLVNDARSATIILVTTLSSRVRAFTSSGNRTKHSCFTTLPSSNATARRC